MAKKIEVLPTSISQLIAAGEVIERPASVVKELMENAIDAGSSEITVELKAGGLQLIRVLDNGEGMTPEDAPLAFQRYATSKIKKSEDLFDIRTLGFRGEALPSIAQVSRMSLLTRTSSSLSGTKVVCEGGEIKKISEIGCPVGTEVEVNHLFYNLPVKRKFLKSIRSELRYSVLHFLRLSLSHPSISFKLIHEGRTLYEHLSSASPWVRIEAIFGKEIYPHLRQIGFENGEIRVSGFASLPSFSKKNTDGIYFYVNQRFVKDRMIYKAILDAYRHVLPRDRFPLLILFITLPPSMVDVNVHPTKSEVKFRDPEKIYQSVLAAVRMGMEEKPLRSEPPPSDFGEKKQLLQKEEFPFSSFQEAFPLPFTQARGEEKKIFMVQEGERPPWEVGQKVPYHVLGQLQGTYILCEGEGNLIVIDQHAGHERVLFEKFKKAYESKSATSEKLLLPLFIELSAEESHLLESAHEALEAIGFEIGRVGEKLFAIRSIPSMIGPKDPKAMIREILDELSFSEREGKGEETLRTLLVTLACHTAIKANFLLRKEEMEELVGHLARFHPTTTCPHGRPIFYLLPLEDLKKQFKRK